MKELVEAVRVTCHDLIEIGNLSLFGKKETKHTAHMVRGKRNTGFRGKCTEPFHELVGARIQGRVRAVGFQYLERRQSGRHRDGIAGQSTGLKIGRAACRERVVAWGGA